jgi:hypothetical protein
MEDFNIKQFLIENKMTRNSRLLSERSQIQTNKPLRNLVIQYIKKELPDGKDIEGLFTHEDIAKEYIKKYVTEEEPNYKAVADSDEEMNEWYKTLSYQIQGRESELNEENINVDDDHLLWMNTYNRLADGSGNLVFAKDGDKYFSGSGKISGGEVTRVKNTKEIPQRQYELYLRMWTQVQKNLTSPLLSEETTMDRLEAHAGFDVEDGITTSDQGFVFDNKGDKLSTALVYTDYGSDREEGERALDPLVDELEKQLENAGAEYKITTTGRAYLVDIMIKNLDGTYLDEDEQLSLFP